MEQYQSNTKNYVVDPNGCSLGDGRIEAIEYPCGAECVDTEGNEQKVGDHMEIE